MKFTMARPEQSCHPEALLLGARSVISAAACYWAPESPLEAGEGRLARYTWADAYDALREQLDELGRRLGGNYRVLVDANQHVDREAAARSGVGFYGKNTMLITRRHGSWVVLGTLVTDVELESTPPLTTDCGECRLCIDACPTAALDEPGTLDATKCLSYWTQAPASDPRGLPSGARRAGLWLRHLPGRLSLNRGVEKRRSDLPEHDAHVRPGCLARAGRRGARRRVRAALRAAERSALAAPERARRPRNTGGPEHVAVLARYAADGDELIADHAAWASIV